MTAVINQRFTMPEYSTDDLQIMRAGSGMGGPDHYGDQHPDIIVVNTSKTQSISHDDSMLDSVLGSGSNFSDPGLDCTDFSDWTEDTSYCRGSSFRTMSDSEDPELDLYNGSVHDGQDSSGHECDMKTLFCEDCQQPICLSCKVNEHLTHKATTLKNAALQRKGKIASLNEELEEREVTLRGQLRRCEEYQGCLRMNKNNVLEKLKGRRDHYHKVIEHWYNKSQDHVHTVCSYEAEKLEDNIATITRCLEEVRENIDYISQLLSYNQSIDILTLSKDIITEAQSDSYDCDPSLLQEVYFVLNTGKGLTPTDLGDIAARYQGQDQVGNKLISSGKLIFSFCTRKGKPSPYSATGLSIDTYGDILVSDVGMDSVQVFTSNGRLLRCLDTLPTDEPSKAVTIDEKVIAVTCKNDIKFFSRKDGSFGYCLDKNLDCPNSMCTDDKGLLIVTDKAEEGPFVHIFDTEDWNIKHTIIGGRRAPVFENPWYVCSDPDGRILVSDLADHTVKVFTSRGILLKELGGQGAQPGQLFRPAGVCIDSCGHILVADSGNNRVQMFSSDGQFCAIIVSDESEGFTCPMDIAIDDRMRLVVLQGNGVVGFYQYLF